MQRLGRIGGVEHGAEVGPGEIAERQLGRERWVQLFPRHTSPRLLQTFGMISVVGFPVR